MCYCQTSSNNTILGSLKFYLFDLESGLSNNVINDIEQDSLGFIWVATSDGLNRYDGEHFKKFQNSDVKKDNPINYNTVYQIKFNAEGKLYLATDRGINMYNPKSESFESINNSTTSFAIDPNDNLILGLYQNGIAFLKKNEKNTFLRNETNNPKSLSSNNITCLTMQGDSTLWVGTRDKGINKINYKTKNVITSSITEKLNYLKFITCIYEDNRNNIWIGSKQGIAVVTKNGEVLKISNKNSIQKLSDDEVLCFEEDNDNHMWIGTRNGGINILNIPSFLKSESKTALKWLLPKEDGTSIFNRTVSALKLDRGAGMWIGTSTGLNYVNTNGEPIQLLQKEIKNDESLSHNRIGALAESHNGNIWIGTDGGGLDYFNPKTKSFKHFYHDDDNPKSLSNNYILSVLEDSKKRVWAGTYEGGLNLLNETTGDCKHYLMGGVDEGSDIRKIFEAKNGSIWIGTNGGGLYKYEENSDQFRYINSLGKIDVRDIEEHKNGTLWIAGYNNILNYNPENTLVTFYNTSNTKAITRNIFFSIEILPNGDILAGTAYGGLVRFNPNGEGSNFTEKDGLSNNSINSIVIQDNKVAWLGTLKGISKYNLETNKIDNLNMFDNVKKSDFAIGAALLTKNGDLYFGSNKGLNIFHPNNLFDPETNYSIILEGLNVFNKPVPITFNDQNAILDKSITYKNHIILDYDKTQFSIDFSILKYPVSSNNTYSYILEGYQDHWVDLKNAHTLNFSNIPPGDYKLNIKGKIGFEKEINKQLLISIKPPFWKTLPAYIFYYLILIGVIWVITKYYNERIKLKNLLLFEKKQRQLESELNLERIRFFTSFSHELKTPLTLILNPIQDLLKSVKNLKNLENVKLIHKNSNYLFKAINKLLEFRKSEVGHTQLFINKYNVNDCMSNIIDYYLPLAKSRDIKLTYKNETEDINIWFDLEKIEIIIHNLLSNALKHCIKDDQIIVSLLSDNENIRIQVKDTGKGIRKEDIPHIFDWFYQSGSNIAKKGTGIGLALSKTFSEMHSGHIEVESNLNEGATFTLQLPRNRKLLKNAIIIETESVEIKESESSIADIWLPTTIEENIDFNFIDSNIKNDKEVLLLIDDNPEILKYLQNILSNDYNILFAHNGSEGIEKAINSVPDLIISDVMMPKKSGIDLCSQLKENQATSHIPIILLTAKDNEESINIGYDKGADDYIAKPFNTKILQTRIKNLINNRSILKKYFTKNVVLNNKISKKHKKLLTKEQEFLNFLKNTILEQISDEEMNVNSISKTIGMSRTSLFRKIKALTGLNINEYIRQVKIRKAAQLIEEDGLTISQAAYHVGFSNAKYFRKIFKEEFGKLPSELQTKK